MLSASFKSIVVPTWTGQSRFIQFSSKRIWICNRMKDKRGSRWSKTISALIFGAVGYGLYQKKFSEAKVSALNSVFSASDVEQHTTSETGIWVAYNNHVYDITGFVEGHPGGSIIKSAAGSSLDPFFNLFSHHLKNEDVQLLLDSMKIGNISNSENKKLLLKSEKLIKQLAYENDPEHDSRLKIRTGQPFVAETPLDLVGDQFITPSELFYVRNHFPVPQVNPNEYILSIYDEDKQVATFSLSDIKGKFEKHEVTAVLQCSANKRCNMNDYKPGVAGVYIGYGLIGNAKWGGVLLKDVLSHLNLHSSEHHSKHIQFEGMDADMANEKHYGVSVPAEIALNTQGDVLLAYEMNGEDLPPNHGYPLRVIVPGVTGARSVKWLNKIVLSKHESSSFWQTKDYRRPTSSVTKNFDLGMAPPLYKMPVNSAICNPTMESSILEEANDVDVGGYAYSGGGNSLLHIEVSIDGGSNWHRVDDVQQCNQPLYQTWAWTLWKITLPIPDTCKGTGEMDILCRAIDASNNVQPESVKGIWNPRGFVNNSWHKIKVNIK